MWVSQNLAKNRRFRELFETIFGATDSGDMCPLPAGMEWRSVLEHATPNVRGNDLARGQHHRCGPENSDSAV